MREISLSVIISLEKVKHRNIMNTFATWLGIAIGAAALAIGYVTYKSQQRKKQLEYLITSSTFVVPHEVSDQLKVTYNHKTVNNAAVTIIRLVNTGNSPIELHDFNSNIVIEFENVNRVVSALSTKTRPINLAPKVTIKGNQVLISPLLINAEDMIELQILTSGIPTKVHMDGRISGAKFLYRKDLPYPPGSGKEGELLGFDKFMWYFFTPVPICAGAIIYLISQANLLPTVLVVLGILAILLYGFYINPLYVKYLVRRRQLWRP